MPNTQNNQNNTNTQNTTEDAMGMMMMTMMTNLMQNMMQNQQQNMQMMQNMIQNQQPQQPQPTTPFGQMVQDFQSAISGTKSMMQEMKADQSVIDSRVKKETKVLELCEQVASSNNNTAKELMKAFGVDPKADFSALKEKKAEEITAECNKQAAEEFTSGMKAYIGTIGEFANTMKSVCSGIAPTPAPVAPTPAPAEKECARHGSGEVDTTGNKMNSRTDLRNEIRSINYSGKAERAEIHAQNVGHPFLDLGKSIESFCRQCGSAASARSDYWKNK